MKKFIKAAIFLFTLLVAGTALQVAQAQTASPVPNPAPAVYVNDIHLSGSSFAAGSVVTGSFTMQNGRNTPASNIVYSVALAADYQTNTLPNVIIDTSLSTSSVFLGPNESKTINFSYTLPKAASGKNFGIEIKALTASGISMGWSDARITLTGNLSMATLTRANVVIDGQKFGLQEGPTLGATSTGSLTVDLSNTGSGTLVLKPTIGIYSRTISGKPVLATTTPGISIKAGATAHYVFPLPVLTSGVYEGQLEFLDGSGVNRVSVIQFRYIIPGDIVTIHSVSSDVSTGNAGDMVKVTVLYDGAPVNIQTHGSVSQSPANLAISLYDQHDVLVGQYSKTIDFSSGLEQASIKLTAAAGALRSVVTIERGGKTLTSYSNNLSANYDALKKIAPSAGPSSNSNDWTLYGIIGLAIIIVIIVIAVIFKKRGQTPTSSTPTTPTILPLILIGLALGATAYFIAQKNAVVVNAQTYSSDKYVGFTETGATGFLVGSFWGYDGNGPDGQKYGLNVFINSPSGPMQPGQQFYLTGSTQEWSCSNESANMYYSASLTFGGTTQTKTYTGDNLGSLTSQNFSIGPFTAPSTAGSYNVNLHIEEQQNWVGTADGVVPITVVPDHGNVDSNNCITVNGWACNSNTATALNVTISDGVNSKTTAANGSRPGLVTNNVCKDPNHNFVPTTPPAFYFDGNSHTVTFTAHDNSNGATITLPQGPNAPSTISCKPPAGNFEKADCTDIANITVKGWACDPNNPSATSRVDIYDGPYTGSNSPVLSAQADGVRPAGTGTACGNINYPNHGFNFTSLPSGLMSGNHTLYAYVVNYSGARKPIGTKVLGACGNVSSQNLPPNVPVIDGPTTGNNGASYQFSVKGDDSNTPPQNLQYGIDWNGDNTVDLWLPASGNVPSGTSESFSNIWTTDGTYTFRALAKNSVGSSNWASHTITISTPGGPVTCPNNQIPDGNGGCTCPSGLVDNGSGTCVPQTSSVAECFATKAGDSSSAPIQAAHVGDNIVWVTNGAGAGYKYSWSGTDFTATNPSDNKYSPAITYSSVGHKFMYMTIYDPSGNQSSVTCSASTLPGNPLIVTVSTIENPF